VTILIADDDQSVIIALKMLFKNAAIDTVSADTPEKVLTLVKQRQLKLALLDLNYHKDTTSGMEGLELISKIKEIDNHLPIVVMTGWGTIQLAVEAIQRGANDFVEKPWDNNRLLAIIKNQLQLYESRKRERKLEAENTLLKQAQSQPVTITLSPAMRQLNDIIMRVAPTDLNILITGENGTGKSMLARQIHQLSKRKDSAIISVNMGAVSDSTFESEMFGHVKGAYTDAKSERIGRIELAEGGTLFLDEIANTPLNQQAKLLHVLEEREYEPLGSSRTQTADIRLISATNANLDTMVSNREFRQDLLFRVNSTTIRIPALRERMEDLPALTDHFLFNIAKRFEHPPRKLSTEALQSMLRYPWPGNIRELHHVLERASVLARSDEIQAEDLQLTPQDRYFKSPEAIPTSSNVTNTNIATPENEPTADSAVDLQGMTLEQAEQYLIEQALKNADGSALAAAKILGLSRSSFYRRLEKYGITPP